MEPSQADAPWTISAPATLVLLTGNETGDAAALRMTLLELIVRRSLKLSVATERRMLLFRREVYVISRGLNFSRRVDGPMQRALDVLPTLPAKTYRNGVTGVPVKMLARAVLKQYQPRYSYPLERAERVNEVQSYVDAEVAPELVRLELVNCSNLLKDKTGSNQQCAYTEKGEAALNQLWQIMEDGRSRYVTWTEKEPATALQFINRSGPAMLLLPTLAPAIKKLFLERRFRGDSRQLRSTFGLYALAETFGPGPSDGFDAASYVLADEVNLAWDSLLRHTGQGE